MWGGGGEDLTGRGGRGVECESRRAGGGGGGGRWS